MVVAEVTPVSGQASILLLYPAEGWPLREWGWKRCRPFPAASRAPRRAAAPAPRLSLPTPLPARRQHRQEEPQHRDQLQPLPPGPARNWGARRGSKPPTAAGQREPSGYGAPGPAGGLHQAPGCWMPGSSWELLGNLPALPRAKSRHIKGGWRQREPGQEPLVRASARHRAPAALHRGLVPARPAPGSCPPPRRGARPIAVATAISSGCIFCTRAAVGTWTDATSFCWALWAAFVAGVEPSWQALPAEPPPAPRGSRPCPGDAGRGLCWNPQHEPTHPLLPPRLWATSSRAKCLQGRPERGPCPRQPLPRHPGPPGQRAAPTAPCLAPSGASSTGAEWPSPAARSEIPMSRSHSPQPANGSSQPVPQFPHERTRPGPRFAAWPARRSGTAGPGEP